MTMLKLAGAAAVASLAFGAASSANATTYLLTHDGCSGTGGCLGSASSAGTVTTSVDGSSIKVTVALDPGFTFHDTSDKEHHALVFDLSGFSSIDIENLTNTPHFTADGTQAAGTTSASPFGDFEYVVNFPKDKTHPVFSTLSFDITTAGVTLNSFEANADGIFFATDVIGNGNTGNVGASGAAVPEPATWAVMLLGFGAVGATLRRSRRLARLA